MPEITFTNSSGLPCEITAGEESCFLLHGESKKLFSKSSSFPFEAAVKKSSEIKCGKLFKSLILSCSFPVRSKFSAFVDGKEAAVELSSEVCRGYICGEKYERLVPHSANCRFEEPSFSVCDEQAVREPILKKERRLKLLNIGSAVGWFCEYYLPIPALFALIFALAYWQTGLKNALIATGIVAAIAAAAAAVVCIPLFLLSKKLDEKLKIRKEKRKRKARSKFRSYRHLLDREYIEAVVFEGG